MKKLIWKLLLALLIVAAGIFILYPRSSNQKTTTTPPIKVQPPGPGSMVVSDSVQATIMLGEGIRGSASIQWVQNQEGEKATVINGPIEKPGAEMAEVTIETSQSEYSERGIGTTINPPDKKPRTYLVCIEGKIGKRGSIIRIFNDGYGKQIQERNFVISFEKAKLVYLLIKIDPTKRGWAGMLVSETKQKSLINGGGK